MSDLIIVAFPDEATAFAAGKALVALQKEHLIEMEDVVVVTRDDTGKVSLHQSVNLTTGGAIGGGIWGTLIGLLFLNPIVGAAVGAGAGALAGKFTDIGIDDQFLRDIGQSLDKGGAAVGLAVVGGWYVTAGPLGVEWVEEAIMDGEPNRAAVQSFTFISPIGEAGRYLLDPTNLGLVRVGVVTVFGVILGAFLYALLSRSFRFEWFTSPRDFFQHLIGGLLMGYGGFVAMGCTVGQGVSGVSTLALGSFLALGGMIAGSALTMKIQFALMD